MFKKLGHFFREYYQLAWVIVTVVIAFGLMVTGFKDASNIVLGVAAIINVIPLVWGMIQDLRHGTYGVDILAATAIVTSVVLGEYWAGMIIVLMLTGGEALEDYAENRAKTELNALLDRVPKKTHLVKGRKTIDIAVSKVQVGDKLLIKPGEVVPVDCVIIEGESSFDESSLTGESLPVDKKPEDQLLSGSVNVEGTVTVKALQTAANSQYEQIIKLVKAASTSQSPFVRLADRYAIPFTIVAFIIAGSAWAMSGDSMRFLQVLVVATPCPLILGAPIAIISGISRAARHGIIIKNGASLEQLAAVKTVAFDKTGTLTVGQPEVKNVTAFGKFKKSDVLAYAAALEQNSNHILAKAVITAAKKDKVKVPKARNVKEVAGHGLVGTVNKQEIVMGKLGFMRDRKLDVPKSAKPRSITSTTSFIAVNGTVIGFIEFADTIREESKATLARLQKLGIKDTLMVTGDNKITAQAIAKQLGITTVKADCLPSDKLLAIEAVKNRPVAFVGDGVNDAPVLTASDVGIALGARGSTAASETADIVIMLDDISKVSDSVAISKRTLKIARESILIGIVISIMLMLIYSTGKFSATSGAAIQELVDITVIIYALRAHGPWKKNKLAII
ncbi:MAG: cobalt ABC transporter ATP-binding protein [Patescibacteria group bacterium]|nr:MAG: cobalt ABC transporter ATP-binding protein [Patescibacteria group bacterium]